MLRAEHLLLDRQAPVVERLRLRVAPLRLVEHSEVIERGRDLGMLRAEHLLLDRQAPVVERLRLRVAPLVDV